MDRETRFELEERLQRLRQEVDETIAALSKAEDAAPPTQSRPTGVSRAARRPVRELLVESLEDLGWPAHARELGLYATARYGRSIEPTRFGSLAADERASFVRGASRPVWLCHGLTHDRGEAIRRLWARSDWPLAMRIVAPTTGRVQHLRMTAKVCELAEKHEASPDKLHYLAADLARDLPGTEVRRGTFDLDGWRATARDELARVEDEDRDRREAAAERLATKLGPAHLLFGAPDVHEGADEPDLREVAR